MGTTAPCTVAVVTATEVNLQHLRLHRHLLITLLSLQLLQEHRSGRNISRRKCNCLNENKTRINFRLRLHDGPKVISPLATSNPASVTQSPTTSLSVSQRIAALGSLGTRRLSESESAQQQPQQTGLPPFSRQNSRDSVSSSRDIPPLGLGPSHRTHSR